MVADRVHQVRLAEADAAVDEQRVVRAPRVLRDLHGRGPCELVALALDERREREVRIQPPADRRQRHRSLAAQLRRTHVGRLDDRRVGPCADLHHDLRRRLGDELFDEFADAGRTVVLDPVHHVAVGREQPQAVALLDRLRAAGSRY